MDRASKARLAFSKKRKQRARFYAANARRRCTACSKYRVQLESTVCDQCCPVQTNEDTETTIVHEEREKEIAHENSDGSDHQNDNCDVHAQSSGNMEAANNDNTRTGSIRADEQQQEDQHYIVQPPSRG
jgi:hypothetical protein